MFSKSSTTQKKLEFENQTKKTTKFVQNENWIENLQNELNQLKNKQAKGAKLRANIRQELEGKKGPKTFFRVVERQNMQT